MACEICGRSYCTKIFHSLEKQEQFDSSADGIKTHLKNIIRKQVNGLDGEYFEDDVYVKLRDVLDIVDSAC